MHALSVPLDHLAPDPAQPRTAASDAELDALADSIRQRGLLLPLRVRPADEHGVHTLVSGHRRLAALRRLGAAAAACVVLDAPPDEAAALADQLAENIIREDLSPIDEADGYRRYLALRGIPAAQAAAELSVPPARISRALALLELPADLRELVHTGRLGKETGYYLSRVPAGDHRRRLFAAAAEGKLTRDEAARAVKAAATPPPAAEGTAPVGRVSLPLPGGRAVTVAGPGGPLDVLIAALEEVLAEARKARRQGWDVSTLARVCRDRAAAGRAGERDDGAGGRSGGV